LMFSLKSSSEVKYKRSSRLGEYLKRCSILCVYSIYLKS
jgi:hypothetical protein